MPISAFFEEQIINTHNAAFAEKKPLIITFIGSGGKTSLIWLLARCLAGNPQRKILVTPSTKMFPPSEKYYAHYFVKPPGAAEAGITLAGKYNRTTGKLESFALPELERSAALFDLVLIEGDGSRELPLKGWAEYEPVVPACTDYTIGIIPLWPLGMVLSEKIIFRLPEFCALCGAQPGDTLTPEHLAAVIGGNEGCRSLFSAGRGSQILFLNCREMPAEPYLSGEIINLLNENFKRTLHTIASINIQQNNMYPLNNILKTFPKPY